MEVAPEGKVKDFEVGVFCGKYQTEVPEGYFEHLNEVRGKKRKSAEVAGTTQDGRGGGSAAAGNSGPVNVAGNKRGLADGAFIELRGLSGVNGDEQSSSGPLLSPENRQDISLHNLANE